jgi:hypothetical protein
MLTMGLRVLGVLCVVAYFFYDRTELVELWGPQGKLALFVIGFCLYLGGALMSAFERARSRSKLAARRGKDDFDLDTPTK